MKNFTRFFIFVLALTSLALSQSFAAKRMVLIEEATNASCPPCAAQNPAFQMWVLNNIDRVIPVTLHSSWPGAGDPMYKDIASWSDTRIQQYYQINGVPNAHVNGLPKGSSTSAEGVSPGSTGVLQYYTDQYKDQESPITLGITETRNASHVTVKIDVNSTESLSGKVLRVYAVEWHHNYPNAGSNGEKDFYWVAKKVMPSIDGAVLTQQANEAKSYNYEYDIASTWNADQMYIVAFIQDDNTHEVLQAVSNAKILSSSVTVNDPFTKVPRSGQVSAPVTIKNNSDVKATFALSVDKTNSYLPTGWSGTVSPATITLDPGATQDVNLTIKSGSNAAFGYAAVVATPNPVAKYFQAAGSNYVYSLTADTKYVLWSGSNQLLSLWTQALATTTYNNDMAVVPFADVTAQAYPSSDFDVNIFTVWSYQIGQANLFSTSQVSSIKQAINAGKDVYATSDISGWFATYADQNHQFGFIKDLYTNYFGVTLPNSSPETRYTVSGNNVTFSTFQVTGVTGDSVGNGINAVGNSNVQVAADLFTDVLAIPTGSPAKSVFYYDNDKAKIGGVRLQKGTSKIVFTSFGLEGFADQASRVKIAKAVLDWFAAASGPEKLGPVIAVSQTSAAFDSVEINKTKDIDIEVKNTGDEDLVINEVYNDEVWDPDGVFSVVKGNTGLPVTIKPNQGSLIITVRFSPKTIKNYTNGDAGSLVIKSNNKAGEEQDIELTGIATDIKGAVDEYTSANGVLTVNALPNVFSTSTNVTVTIGGQRTRNVELTVVDETGRTVATLASEAMAPGQITKEFNAGALASGTYYIIATTDGTAVRVPVKLAK